MARIKTLHNVQKESTGEGSWPAGVSVGILGGGQLARMLGEAAARLGLNPIAFSGNEDCPVARLGVKTMTGGLKDMEAFRRFLSSVRFCVYESEFISVEMLKLASSGVDVSFFPPLNTMAQFQDKIRQKECCEQLKIPTAPFLVHDRSIELGRWIEEGLEKFEGTAVLKWGRMGYDGKGVFVLKDTNDSKRDGLEFCKTAVRQKIPLYAEKKINFKRELALMGCYSVTGDFKSYPLVISEQENGVCNRVYGPATALGVAKAREEQASEAAQKLAETYSLYGCFGIEFFETEEGELLVNEIAPRVHNSGHYTQEGCATSQFENHWRAVLGMPLGEVAPTPGFAMQNLLGPEHVSLDRENGAVPVPSPRAHLHWYDKADILPRRKLGHLNGVVSSPDQIDSLLKELKECKDKWQENLMERGREKEHG